ncbi:helix-turn-helix transcriptional regulator [Anaerosolibacter sp.]|uniref:helix-turn-helix transcriptional regulator n=1 Tax=Anaerosolibacter sp. TaxID=1872527 RepID=UPI0039F1352C
MRRNVTKINTLKIKALRMENEFTQDDISKLLGISPNTYHRKETGISEFTLSEAKKISTLFKKPIEDIFFAS